MQTKKIKTEAAARTKDKWASDMLPPCLCVLCEHSPEEDGRRVCANGDPLRLCTQISLPLVVWHIPLGQLRRIQRVVEIAEGVLIVEQIEPPPVWPRR